MTGYDATDISIFSFYSTLIKLSYTISTLLIGKRENSTFYHITAISHKCNFIMEQSTQSTCNITAIPKISLILFGVLYKNNRL